MTDLTVQNLSVESVNYKTLANFNFSCVRQLGVTSCSCIRPAPQSRGHLKTNDSQFCAHATSFRDLFNPIAVPKEKVSSKRRNKNILKDNALKLTKWLCEIFLLSRLLNHEAQASGLTSDKTFSKIFHPCLKIVLPPSGGLSVDANQQFAMLLSKCLICTNT
ncbi:hypothetical protein EGR_03156 [Echinococcus granulosus]|uniref:Uncharacterized protein n=1 Tax=Echinococcus granulosus TaxID=6210 RepID=W6ULC8_ECHGR|nr:hypothetical protein EGR_03156 [Echinococcus granulosus]EUB61883.1 hypothetical protein EGR_03156 [Echinococcus granulosus]